jgi:N-methylhydantoinase A
MGNHRVTVDTGGTFSDFVYLDEDSGEVSITKIASTPDDPSRAILEGIATLLARGIAANAIRFFCHGTTVGTNALLEGKGAKTGLLVTEGFRGIYPVAEQSRPYGPATFDLMYEKPAMLVPQNLTGEVAERVDFRGHVLHELDEQALRATVRDLAEQNIESMAVCLLFSFLHPQHEARVGQIVAEEMPGCSISLSSEVLPQIREYYRLSTTVINAYLQPILARYLAQLDQRLVDASIITPQKYVMQSNGGMATFDGAAQRAVTTLLSGPAGGVTAGAYACRMTGFRNLITFDMGGTSCDVALIKDGAPSLASRGKIDDRDLAVPMLDINTVSAGGGTIARLDRLGVLEVGPQSAGAVPGPACYGRGGAQPTITDCNLILGFLSEDNFLGGRMRLDLAKARRSVEEYIAKPLGMSVEDAASGIIRIIDVKMEEAIKAISTMRGHDLRDFMLIAFGGAGPLHAGRIARGLSMAGVIIPLYPGVYSAIGLLMSDVKHDYVRSRIAPLHGLHPEEVDKLFTQLETQADTELNSDGFDKDQICIKRALDLRYAGQGYEITLPFPPGGITAEALKALRSAFDAQHSLMFGHSAPEETVEVVSFRVRGTGRVPAVEMPKFKRAGTTLSDALRTTRRVRFDSETIDCPIYQRENLDVGLTVPGPAVLDQLDCTTVLFPGQTATIDEWKNLIVTMQK